MGFSTQMRTVLRPQLRNISNNGRLMHFKVRAKVETRPSADRLPPSTPDANYITQLVTGPMGKKCLLYTKYCDVFEKCDVNDPACLFTLYVAGVLGPTFKVFGQSVCFNNREEKNKFHGVRPVGYTEGASIAKTCVCLRSFDRLSRTSSEEPHVALTEGKIGRIIIVKGFVEHENMVKCFIFDSNRVPSEAPLKVVHMDRNHLRF